MRLLFVLTLALLVAACGDDGGSMADAAPDAAPDTSMDAAPDAPAACDLVPALGEGDAMGHADPLGSDATEARAGRLAAADLPADPSRLLTWEPGDFVLANDRIAIVIEDAGPSDGFDPWGGKVVGVARVEGGALVSAGDFNELIPAVGRFTVEPRSVTVLEAGGPSGAVVRAVGNLHAIPLIDEVAATLAPGDFTDIEVAIDYRLAPGAEHVEVSYVIRSERTFDRPTPQIILSIQSSRMPRFGPEQGFFLPNDETLPFIGFADEDATSYAVEFLPEPIGAPLEVSGAAVFIGGRVSMPPCAVTPTDYYRLHVGGAGMSGLRAAMWRTEGTAVEHLVGVVRDAEGAPAPGVRVHAESADGSAYFTRDLTDAEGRYGLDVPSGVDARFSAWRRGEGVVGPVAGPDIVLPATGTLEIAATDGAGAAIPVRVQTRPVGDTEPLEPDERFGELAGPRRRTHNVHPSSGLASLRVSPGTHRVIVSRGYEYEIFDSDVVVTAGASTVLDVALDRVVDTAGVMCADYHLHTNRSPDSPDSPELKLRGAAAEGVEIPCRSDHDWVTEWDSIALAEGLGDHVFGLTSLEITSPSWGHFGVVPAEEQATPNRGAVPWWEREPTALFADVYAMTTDPVLVINHPRFSGLGYFDFAGYDPVTGMVSNADLWDDRFRVIEVFNEASFDGSAEEVQDWFSFLNRGVRMFAVGSSDSHEIVGQDWEVGYPRTCLRLGLDDTAALRAGGGEALVRDATRAGTFVVSGGIYIDAVARGDVRPGGELTGAMATESIAVRVQAASWIDVDTLEVYVDGELAETFSIAPTMDVVRFEESIDITPGSWVVFHAKGDMALDPVHQGHMPFGVTMPIFMTP